MNEKLKSNTLVYKVKKEIWRYTLKRKQKCFVLMSIREYFYNLQYNSLYLWQKKNKKSGRIAASACGIAWKQTKTPVIDNPVEKKGNKYKAMRSVVHKVTITLTNPICLRSAKFT